MAWKFGPALWIASRGAPPSGQPFVTPPTRGLTVR